MILIDHLIFWIFGIADILLCNNIQRQCKIYSITWFECCELVSVWEVSIAGCPQRLARKKHGNVYSAQTMFVFVRYAIMNIFFNLSINFQIISYTSVRLFQVQYKRISNMCYHRCNFPANKIALFEVHDLLIVLFY